MCSSLQCWTRDSGTYQSLSVEGDTDTEPVQCVFASQFAHNLAIAVVCIKFWVKAARASRAA